MSDDLALDLERTPFVFVYGTLKKGQGNNILLRNAEFIGSGVSDEHHMLTDCGFPYLWDEKESGLPVRGEVYKVTDVETLENLDILEGVGCGHYERVHGVFYVGEYEYDCWFYKTSPDIGARCEFCGVNENGEFEWS